MIFLYGSNHLPSIQISLVIVIVSISRSPIINNEEVLKSLGIKTLCKLTADLRAVPINLFAKQAGPTIAPHYEVNYILSATVQSDKIVFELVFQGKVYGVAEAEMNVL